MGDPASVGPLLRLLHREAPEDEFLRLLELPRPEGHDPAEVALAAEISRRLSGYRRRTNELRALYETAGDLSSLRDVEKVLRAIVQRGRQLVGTDVSYLMLVDEERGDTYMRVTEGTFTQGFEKIRLDPGYGLGGVVAQTGVPYATPDYLRDVRFVEKVNQRVHEENLVAILGVPLKIGRRVIGVLFAADRHARDFAPEEVALLTSLATHAALAIENSSRLEELETALDSLTAANVRLEEHSAAVERAATAHERFSRLVLRGGSLTELAQEVSTVFQAPVAILDSRRSLLADARWSNSALPPATLCDDISRWSDSVPPWPSGEDVDNMRARSSEGMWAAPIVAGRDRLGLLLLRRERLGDADIRTLERAAMVTALLMVSERAVDEANNRLRDELLSEVMRASESEFEALRRRARLLGVDLDGPHVLVVTSVGRQISDRERARDVVASYVLQARGLFGHYGENFIALVPGSDPPEVGTALADRLQANAHAPATLGLAGPVWHLADIPGAAAEAERCVHGLIALGRCGEVAEASDLGVYGLLLCGDTSSDRLHAFVANTLEKVLIYDASNGTRLLETMETYFDMDCHAAQAAERLYIHSNTLYQRLDRIDRLLGAAWRSGDRALQTRLAIKLWRLSKGAVSRARPDRGSSGVDGRGR